MQVKIVLIVVFLRVDQTNVSESSSHTIYSGSNVAAEPLESFKAVE
jgi:hypothetical protein